MNPALLALAALAAAPAPGPTLAVEDTLHTTMPEVLVAAPRVTLDEILDRVARGEAHRDSLLEDQAFTFTLRVVGNVAAGREPRLLAESVHRVFRKRPDRVRSVTLREYRHREGQRGSVQANFRSSMSEEIVNFAFRPEARHDYRYAIAGRDVIGGRVIYRIDFAPRSRLAFDKPHGRVWVDTSDFVIVREELSFDRSPAPLILKDIDRMVIERKRVEGHWVLDRVLIRMSATVPLPTVGRRFDMALMYDDYALNRGLGDALFEGAPPAGTR
jgi:hypothetical protein